MLYERDESENPPAAEEVQERAADGWMLVTIVTEPAGRYLTYYQRIHDSPLVEPREGARALYRRDESDEPPLGDLEKRADDDWTLVTIAVDRSGRYLTYSRRTSFDPALLWPMSERDQAEQPVA